MACITLTVVFRFFWFLYLLGGLIIVCLPVCRLRGFTVCCLLIVCCGFDVWLCRLDVLLTVGIAFNCGAGCCFVYCCDRIGVCCQLGLFVWVFAIDLVLVVVCLFIFVLLGVLWALGLLLAVFVVLDYVQYRLVSVCC